MHGYLLLESLDFFPLTIICSKCKNKDEKKIKEEEPVEILKILVLTERV